VRVTGDTDGRAEMCGAVAEGTGRNLGEGRRSVSNHLLAGGTDVHEQVQLMERVVERSNMQAAYRRVKKNKGAPGGRMVCPWSNLDRFFAPTGQRSKNGFVRAGTNRCR